MGKAQVSRSGLGDDRRGVRAKEALPDPVVGEAEPAGIARLAFARDEHNVVQVADVQRRDDHAEMLLQRAAPLVVHA